MIEMKWISTVLLFSLPVASVRAQQPLPAVDQLISQLYTYGEQYIAKLPSLSCDEAITSQVIKNGKVQKEVRIQSSLREVRKNAASNEFSENHFFISVNGAPPSPKVSIPFFVQGGFASALSFPRADRSACLSYQLASQDNGKTLKLEMTAKPENTEQTCPKTPIGYREIVLVDAASGRVTYVERSVSEEESKRNHSVFFASMEYGPQVIGDETLWLPVRMAAHDPKNEGRMVVAYSNYHRYTASSVVLPAGEPMDTK